MQGYLLVQADGERLGIRVGDVRAVLDAGEVAPAPGGHPAVRGVMRVRDRPVPLVDLPLLLGRGAGRPEARRTVVLVHAREGAVALAVDEAEAVVREATLPLPPSWRLPWAGGVARSAEGLIPIVDMAVLIEWLTTTRGEGQA